MRSPTNVAVLLGAFATLSCAHRGTLPTDSPVRMTMRSSECPPYEVAVHDDGTVDYLGRGWAMRKGQWGKRVPREAVEKVCGLAVVLGLEPAATEIQAKFASAGCQAFGPRRVFFSLRSERGWAVACSNTADEPRFESIEKEVLEALEIREWVQLPEPCVME